MARYPDLPMFYIYLFQAKRILMISSFLEIDKIAKIQNQKKMEYGINIPNPKRIPIIFPQNISTSNLI